MGQFWSICTCNWNRVVFLEKGILSIDEDFEHEKVLERLN